MNSVSTDPVTPAAHAAWLDLVLSDPDRVLVIGEETDGVAIGMVRFDLSDSDAEVSINLALAARGRSLSAPLLVAAERWVDGRVNVLRARIKPGNIASTRAFERAGYWAVDLNFEEMTGFEKRL
jgi:RimJ/RimL family protein N-acetyltransferase